MIHAQNQLQGSLGIERMCRLADISRAGYYRHWKASRPAQEETALRDEIQHLSLEQRFYGYRRITALLRRTGWAVNHKRVQRIRQTDNLLCVTGRTFRPATTDSRHRFRVYPNLARRMVPMAPNQLWVADITYVRLDEAFVYLAVVLDAFSRAGCPGERNFVRIHRSERRLWDFIATSSIRVLRRPFESAQYACGDYICRLEQAGVQPSMSRPGCPWDNAMAESFMRTLKREEVDGRTYRDLPHAREKIVAFIDTVYNRQRLHSARAYRAPELFEDDCHEVCLSFLSHQRDAVHSLCKAAQRDTHNLT